MICLEKIKKNKKILLIIFFILLLIILDQTVKSIVIGKDITIIENVFKINAVENYGGAFGVGQTGTMTFVITNIIVIGIILKFMRMQEEQIDKKTYFALSLIIAGALSNLIDKLFRGYVLEFLKVKAVAFNIADILIILGWILLALFFAMHTSKIKIKKGR